MDAVSRRDTDVPSPLTAAFRIGEWTVEPAWNRISAMGETRKVEPRVMRVLATLAAASGRPLTREGLLDSVWAGVHVNEEALSRAVSELRRALGDDPAAPRYIATIRKGGYSLVMPVEPIDGAVGGSRAPPP